MTHLCEYGCGQAAIYYKLPSDKVPNGRYMCNISPNSCPTKRRKTTGNNNPAKRSDVRKTISDVNLILFASGSDLRNKCKATLQERYGVNNPSNVPGSSQKRVAKRRSKNNYNANPYWLQSIKSKEKVLSTKISKGLIMDPALRLGFDRYEWQVDILTSRNYKQHKEIINPQNLQRGRTKGSYQLDHIISKVAGFNQNIDPELIAHPANLQMLSIEKNISKGIKSDYTKEQLVEAIRIFSLNTI